MKCISCKRRIKNDSNYCRICGKRQKPDPAENYYEGGSDFVYDNPEGGFDYSMDENWSYDQNETTPQEQTPAKPAKKKKTGLIAAAAVCAVLALCLTIIFVTRDTEPEWKGNLLMESTLRQGSDANLDDCYGLGYMKCYIDTVTFQDDLSGKPDNARDVSQHGNGTVWAWVVENEQESDYHLYIAAEGGVNGSVACSGLFANYSTVKEINFDGAFHTDYAESMQGMFYGCNELAEVDIHTLNTSNVTNMSAMFFECSDLTQLDISHFHTEHVVDFSYMFTECYDLQTLNLGAFDTSSATNMRQMFCSTEALLELDVSGFDTSRVYDMSEMFSGCGAAVDASGFDVAYVSRNDDFMKDCNGVSPFN